VISTGTGATGWAASLHRERHSQLVLPGPQDGQLAFFVREPWPSPVTAVELTEGLLKTDALLTIRSQNPEDAVIFGDGIEADRIPLDWGQEITLGPAAETLALVA
jgi:hypothetical protein